ncbi:hypothetical protein NL108_004440 [Boleophthalmus pectinirostris]|nr:hypothetical protein NL108_004440 [Boleophthalmus pectinirostris]
MATHASGSLTLLLLVGLVTVTSGCAGHSEPTEAPHSSKTSITIVVTNTVTNGPERIYTTFVYYQEVLLGGLQRLQDSIDDFSFTYTEDPHHGFLLESINGLYVNSCQGASWKLWVQKPDGTIITDIGIGCYIPVANDKIIFNFSTA